MSWSTEWFSILGLHSHLTTINWSPLLVGACVLHFSPVVICMSLPLSCDLCYRPVFRIYLLKNSEQISSQQMLYTDWPGLYLELIKFFARMAIWVIFFKIYIIYIIRVDVKIRHFMNYNKFYLSIVCVNFCCTAKWFGYTCIYSQDVDYSSLCYTYSRTYCWSILCSLQVLIPNTWPSPPPKLPSIYVR